MATEKKLQQLLASVLDAEFTNGDEVDCFTVIEAALTKLGIKSILPCNAQHVGIAELSDELSRGDHIVMRLAGSNAVFHHGIYIGPYTPHGEADAVKPKKYVVDMFGEDKQSASLRLRTMDEFIRNGYPDLAVIRYSNDTQAARDRSADLALRTQYELHDCTGLYNLLGFNCNHFATWCRTMRWVSADVTTAYAYAHEAACCLQPLKAPLSKTLRSF
jgi:hypothetical protein